MTRAYLKAMMETYRKKELQVWAQLGHYWPCIQIIVALDARPGTLAYSSINQKLIVEI